MKTIVLFLSISLCINAQFNVQGTIDNYNNQDIFIYKYINNVELLMVKTQTNEKGKFNYKNKDSYNGILKVFLPKAHVKKMFFVDNNDIEFSATFENDRFRNLKAKDKTNSMFYTIEEAKTNAKKAEILKTLKDLYSKQNAFYPLLEKELTNTQLQTNIDLASAPLLEYFINTENNFINKAVNSVQDADNLSQAILNKLVNDNQYLEQSTLLTPLVNTYISNSVAKYPTSEEQMAAVRPAIDSMLDETIIETSRGQNVLLATINVLKSYGLDYIAEEYIAKASALTCEITPELKKTIKVNESIKVGEIFPDFEFNLPQNNKKIKSVYDIKSEQKLVIFWGSFCPHCKDEKPILQSFYNEFKQKGGEIITFGIETNKVEHNSFTQGLDWYVDTDFLYWSSPNVEKYNIGGTPTLFLLDKDNRIVEIAGRFEFIKDKIK